MIQLLMSNARACLAWGAAAVVIVAGAAGASVAGAAGVSQPVSVVGASMVALVPTTVLFGLAAAILDLHRQMTTLAAALLGRRPHLRRRRGPLPVWCASALQGRQPTPSRHPRPRRCLDSRRPPTPMAPRVRRTATIPMGGAS